ncbi:ATP-grasp fold amidoligase family protein [Actinomyces sp.]|uniref:ATP-grasp fold amidoligase family protein n=1 Tax=Actinomyces sp. TaxID=29317 RepID=UPI0026DB4AC1|nr:ATP-grasp fold amidoligase family protein [Actinomyces sp.]MDO4899165.1 ATP-grasp fold amidoligase family protein [Actinomyces sp.]
MNIKRVVKGILPPWVLARGLRALHRRNCKLQPEEYRAALVQWCWFMRRPCDLDSPRTLADKIHWLKLYDSTPLKGRLADKFLVREWVAERIGDEYLLPLRGVWDDPNDIDFDRLPDRFVLKATHGSGWNVLVHDKDELDVARTRRTLGDWLTMRHAMRGGFELHYEFCEPRIICEDLLEDGSGGLRDYKFMTFDGVVQFIFVVDGRYSGIERGTYLPDWTRAPFEYVGDADIAGDVDPPARLDEMSRLAEELGRGFACARVDFYEVEGRVFFGEITFTDANGMSFFVPEAYDIVFGDRLVLPEKKTFKGVML